VRNPGPDIQAESAQLFGDKLGRLEFAVCEFGMPMNPVPKLDHRRRLAGNACSDGSVGD
jgi:hypothetical protein